MKTFPCNSYRRQIALLSAQALDHAEESKVREHLGSCPGCQAYWMTISSIANLYHEDAARMISLPEESVTPEAVGLESPQRRGVWSAPWPRLAMAACGVIIITVVILISRPSKRPVQVAVHPPDIAPALSPSPSSPSIAAMRHLAGKDLDEIIRIEGPKKVQQRDFVFSARMRQGEP